MLRLFAIFSDSTADRFGESEQACRFVSTRSKIFSFKRTSFRVCLQIFRPSDGPGQCSDLFGPTVRKLSILVIETLPSKLFSYSIFDRELGGTLLAVQVQMMFLEFFLFITAWLSHWRNKEQSERCKILSDDVPIGSGTLAGDLGGITFWNPWSNKRDANLEDSACTVRVLLFFPILRICCVVMILFRIRS